MIFGFIIIPLIGLIAVLVLVMYLPAIVKVFGLSKYIDATTLSFTKALLLSGAILFLIFNILQTVFY